MKFPKFSVLRLFVLVIVVPTSMVLVTIATMHHDTREHKVTAEVWLDVGREGKSLGRMVVGLFGEDAPRTVANFVTLATRGHQGRHYRGTPFHRVIKKFMIQGGDVESGDGQGSYSIYGPTFPDENLDIHHSRPGFFSMANRGKDTNGCQFFITTVATPWLDGHHVVFGKLVEGESVMREIEYAPTDWHDRPLKDITITGIGRRKLPDPYYITDDPYNLRDWIKTISVPIGFSFCIIFLFNHFINKLDSAIIDDDGAEVDEELEEKREKKKEKEEEEEGGKGKRKALEAAAGGEKKKKEEEKEKAKGEVRKRKKENIQK